MLDYVRQRDKALNVCYFGNTGTFLYDQLKRRTSSGCVVANDLLVNYACTTGGFGGVGGSGIGKIRGYPGFRECSNAKVVIERSSTGFLDIPMRYLPETQQKLSQMRMLTNFAGSLNFERVLCRAVQVLLVGIGLAVLVSLYRRNYFQGQVK